MNFLVILVCTSKSLPEKLATNTICQKRENQFLCIDDCRVYNIHRILTILWTVPCRECYNVYALLHGRHVQSTYNNVLSNEVRQDR